MGGMGKKPKKNSCKGKCQEKNSCKEEGKEEKINAEVRSNYDFYLIYSTGAHHPSLHLPYKPYEIDKYKVT